MNGHVSVLNPGCCPHPPHAHREEELLIVLRGEAEVLVADNPAGENSRRERIRAGAFTFYPAYQHHTISNSSDQPITYLMFKWFDASWSAGATQPVTIWSEIADPSANGPAFDPHLLFESPTIYLRKLHAHRTTMQPGAGYDSHCDKHDVAIVLLEGEIEINGRIYTQPAVIFFSAGERHDLHNLGQNRARYLVFEFHGAKEVAISLGANGGPAATSRPFFARMFSALRRRTPAE